MTKNSYIMGVAILLIMVACNEVSEPNTLSRKEKRQGFELLFNGVNTEGWRGYQKDHLPAMWIIDQGMLHCQDSGMRNAGPAEGGDIIYDKMFANFHLKLEWKIAEAGNSGILYLGSEDTTYKAIYMTAPEMQVLDNAKHPDAKLGTNGNRMAGSLYDLIPAKPQNFKGAGEWNQAELIVKDKHVKHIQNGEVVVEYVYGTQMWEALVARSKFPGLNPDWVNLQEEGYIGLQDHNDKVWFRNIKIKEL